MEQDELRNWERLCIQEEPPECTAACPIHVDARAFVRELRHGNWTAAFDVLARSMPFPGILGRICDHPCEARCTRVEVDEPVALGLLERVCVTSSIGTKKSQLLPRRPHRVAVVGGGLAGMTAASDLLRKGFSVTLLEPDSRLGGSLWEIPRAVLPEEVLLAECGRLADAKVDVRLDQRIDADRFEALCQEYDALFVDRETARTLALPLGRDEDGAIAVGLHGATDKGGVYAGGGTRYTCAYSPVTETFEGRRGALSIERYLQKAAMDAGRENEGPFVTRLVTRSAGVRPVARVVPMDPVLGYSREEAAQEALRCMQCECMECAKACLYIERYGAYPKRYARQVFSNERVPLGALHTKNQFVNSCSECGLCEVVCPNNFNMGDLCAQARRTMVANKLMPESFHEFALQDMAYSLSEHCALTRNEPGRSASAWLYFPSCQLCGTSPAEVVASYNYLRKHLSGGVGIALGCCGVPAAWAGRDDLFREALAGLSHTWAALGRPRVIAACSNCLNVFREHLPDTVPVSLWEVLEKTGLPRTTCTATGSTVSIVDPCTARYDREVQNSVRRITKTLGVTVEELPLSRELAECCGYGGLMYNANPELAADVIAHRLSPAGNAQGGAENTDYKAPAGWYREVVQAGADTVYYQTSASEHDYLAYCAMCRDNFAGAGKRVSHLIEHLFPGVEGADPAARGWISWSERRVNRSRVKRAMLRLFGEEEADAVEPEEHGVLAMSDAVRRTIDERRILEDDVRTVIEQAEATGAWLQSAETGHLLAYSKLGNVTFWVEYAKNGDTFTVFNAYSHRMKIVGVKQ